MIKRILHVLIAFAERFHVFGDGFAVNQALFEEISDNFHFRLFHAEARHFLRAEPNARRFRNPVQRLERQQVHVRNDVIVLQLFGNHVARAELRHIHRDLVAFREAEFDGLHVETAFMQLFAEKLRVRNRLFGVCLPEFQHFNDRDGQRGQRVQMVIRGRAGERRPVNLFPIRVFEIAQHHAALRAEKRFMRAAVQNQRAFRQRVLKLLPGNQAQHVRAVINQRDLVRLAEFGQLFDRLREQKQAFPQHHHFRLQRFGVFQRFVNVNMITVRRGRKVDDVARVFADGTGAMMADMAAARRGIDHHDIARLNERAEHRVVRQIAAHGANVSLTAMKERLDAFRHARFDFVNNIRALIIAFAGVAFGVAVREIRRHDVPRPAAHGVFAGNQIDRAGSPFILLLRQGFYVRDLLLCVHGFFVM